MRQTDMSHEYMRYRNMWGGYVWRCDMRDAGRRYARGVTQEGQGKGHVFVPAIFISV